MACGQAGSADSTAAVSPSSTTTPVPLASTTTDLAPGLTDCPAPRYEAGALPERVSTTSVAVEDVDQDSFTSLPGTRSQIWLADDGGLAVAIIRGSLPPEEWPGAKGEVIIDGVRAIAGQYADGTWVVGWFEEPGDRCDLYTMVFYQPVSSAEVSETLASMNRVAG